MRHVRFLPCFLIVVAAAVLLSGCSTGPSEEEQRLAALQERAVQLKQSQETLDQQRAELVAANSELAELQAVAERRRSEEQTQRIAELETQIGETSAALDSGYAALQDQLAAFLNEALNNFPQDPVTLEGLEVYSKETMINAEDIIANSGDYKKAIEQLTTAQGYYEGIGKPPLPLLEEKISEYDDWRFITQERFDSIKNGMTPEEVTEIAGVVYYQNVREQDNTTTWLYKRRDGGVAAITFNSKGKVYHTNFDAVRPEVVQD